MTKRSMTAFFRKLLRERNRSEATAGMTPMLRLTEIPYRSVSFWGLSLASFGLPLSNFLVSVGIILLAVSWVAQGKYTARLRQFITDPLSLTISAMFLIHVAGMLHTEDLSQGFKQLRIMLPMLLLPLLLFTTELPPPSKQRDLLHLFVLACLLGTFMGAFRYAGLSGEELINKRHLSIFISHIRFGLMLVLAICILLHGLYQRGTKWSLTEKVIAAAVAFWLFAFLFFMETVTAQIAFLVIVGFTLLRLLFRWNRPFPRIVAFVAFFAFAGGMGWHAYSIYSTYMTKVPLDHRTLNEHTLNGRFYAHRSDIRYRENGHRTWNFVCWEELRNEWPKVASTPMDSADGRGQPLKFTLIRYMTSLGLKKDSAGVHQLSQEDVENIEAGHTNHLYTSNWGIAKRSVQFLREMEEYRWSGKANNSSLFQRWVYTKVGWRIFEEHPLVGVGTGDLRLAYDAIYAENDHNLLPRFQNISHNQFLTVMVTLGVFGLLVFLIGFLYPLWRYRNDHLYACFWLLILVSFLSDNTLDSQTGVTLYAFFNTFLIIRKEFENASEA